MDDLESVIEQLKQELGEDKITTASDPKIKRPERALERDMYKDFMDRNPLAGGGMLVQPGFGGTRQGYSDGPKMTMVREYLTNLPKKSKVAPVDLSKELEVDRKLIDNALKEKKFKNKFNVVRKKDALTGEEFIKEYKKYQKSDFFKTGTDGEFANYLNDQGLKPEDKKGANKFTAESVKTRRQRLNIKSVSPSAFRLDDKFVLKEAKRFKIDTKGLSSEEIRSKVLDKRQAENLRKKRAADPELDERLKEEAIERAKKRRQRLLSTEEGRAILREQSRKEKAKKYLKEGIDPPANSAKEMLWKDTVKTAKEDSRFSIKSGYKKSMKKSDYYSDKIKIKDSVTGKTFTFNTLENFINKNAKSFNIKNYEEVIKPYKQKQFINDKGLRNILNEALIPNYNPGNPANAFTIQHDFGRNNNPFKVSLAFYDENLKEYKIRSDFEKAWEKSKRSKTPLTDRKKAFNVFKEGISELNIQSAPSMVTRDRFFGKGLDLTKAIRAGKEAGAKIPRGMLKEASEFDKQMNEVISSLENSDQIRLARIGCPGKATGGRVGYFEGQNLTACAIKGAERIKNDPINLTGGDQQNLRALGKSVKAVRFLKNFLGPAAIAGELIFEGGFAANKFMSEGVPLKQALGESYINRFVLGPKTQIDVEAERAKEFAKGEEFAMAERGRRMAPFMAQSKEADEQRQKERMQEMISLYPQYSDQQLINMLQDAGYNPQDIINQQTTTRITPAVTSTLSGLDQLRTGFQEQDALQRIATAGGVANLAGGGIAGLSGGIDEGPQIRSMNPDSQGLSGLLKRGIKG